MAPISDELLDRLKRLETELAAAKREIWAVRRMARSRLTAQALLMVTAASTVAASLTAGAAAPVPHRVKAPFEVVDSRGKAVFAVTESPRGWQLKTAAGQIVAVSSALDVGGFFKALAPDQKRQVAIGVSGPDFAGVIARQSDSEPRATLGIAKDGKGTLEILNDNGIAVSNLGVGASGGGQLQIADASGHAMVEGYITPGGVGAVVAYPIGTPGAGLIGLPGTFIIGRLGAK